MQINQALNNFIHQKNLFTKKDRLLLAVSGGLDSIAMLHLLHNENYKIAVAHCNFSLRGKESDNDELFVEALCLKLSIPFHKTRFDTSAYADENAISIQLAARNLRYEWFAELCNEFSYDSICTAHHSNDSAETILFNLTRGSGLSGISGIPAKNNNIVRPLLSLTRSELEVYASQQKLEWRNDSSNNTDEYSRNLIRHKVIPVLQALNPSLEETLLNFSSMMKENDFLIREYVQQLLNPLTTKNNDTTILSTHTIKHHPAFNSILFYFLADFAVQPSVIPAITEAIIERNSGRQFFSKKFRVLTDRDQIIITSLQYMEEQPDILVEAGLTVISLPDGLLRMQLIDPEPETMFRNHDPHKAFLDASQLNFPLRCRRWIKGDYFYPLGMEHRQKLSDYFIDHKVPVSMKEISWLLMNDDEIVWVIAHRIDQRYRITENTEKVLALEWRPHGTATAL